jgi:hypothetical protein
MKRLLVFPVLFSSATLLLAACSGEDDPVQAFIASSGQTYTSCGVIEVPATCGAPSEEQSKAISCLVQAECKPVRLDVRESTIEGDPIITTYLVVPKQDGCGIEQFIDGRQDSFGDGEVTQSHCESVAASEECPWVAADGCIGECGSDTDCG